MICTRNLYFFDTAAISMTSVRNFYIFANYDRCKSVEYFIAATIHDDKINGKTSRCRDARRVYCFQGETEKKDWRLSLGDVSMSHRLVLIFGGNVNAKSKMSISRCDSSHSAIVVMNEEM